MHDRIPRYWVLIVLMTLFSVLTASCGKSITQPEVVPDASAISDSGVVQILFIGASYFGNQLLPLFRELAGAGGKEVRVEGAISPGVMLDAHATSASTRQRIQSRKWDVVILQGVCVNAGYPETHQDIFPPYVAHPLLPSLKTLYARIKENHADTKMIYTMPWAFEDGTLWLNGGTDTYADMQLLIYDNVLGFAKEVDMGIAPVGWAWYQVLKEPPALHYLHASDYNHPSNRGTYLMGCVFYVSLFGEPVSGNPVHGKITTQESVQFQQIADDVVLKNWPVWKLHR